VAPFPAFVTCLALLVYLWTGIACAMARRRYNIVAPAVTGAPEFERALRIQQNTVEQLVLFLPSLWLFSHFLSPFWGGVLGLVFVLARAYYIFSYSRDPASRGPGFVIGYIATLVLLAGGILGIFRVWLGS